VKGIETVMRKLALQLQNLSVKRIKFNLNHYLRSIAPVQLHDFVLMGGIFHEDPTEINQHLTQSQINPVLNSGQFYPLFYNSNPRTLELLEILIRKIRPTTVVETGVANGESTRRILSVFRELNLTESKLFSFDVDPRVASGELFSNPQFNFVLVDSQNKFSNGMKDIGLIDLFYHDSDHSYINQMLEYDTAWDILNPQNGVLVSDDINWSNAFLDFCKKVKRTPFLLSDRGKFSGVIFKDVPKC
jgi:predicted O-methyltransferase YrrM